MSLRAFRPESNMPYTKDLVQYVSKSSVVLFGTFFYVRSYTLLILHVEKSAFRVVRVVFLKHL